MARERFPVSGTNATSILASTASINQQIYGITSGKVFWLRGVKVAVNATNGPVLIKDATVGSTATTPVLVVDLATAQLSGEHSTLNFSDPGIKFSTNVVAAMDASGSVPIGQITVWGYEE